MSNYGGGMTYQHPTGGGRARRRVHGAGLTYRRPHGAGAANARNGIIADLTDGNIGPAAVGIAGVAVALLAQFYVIKLAVKASRKR